MELNNYEVADTTFLQLRNPTTNDLLWEDAEKTQAVGVIIFGQDSPQFKDRQRSLMNQRIEIQSQSKGRVRTTAEEIEQESMRTLVACVHEFVNISVDGKTPGKTPNEIEAVLKRFPWVQVQVDDAIMDRARFIKASSKK